MQEHEKRVYTEKCGGMVHLLIPDQKIYVNTDGTASFICPHCGDSKTTNVSRYKDLKEPLRVKCVCKEYYEVHLEFRRSYRKPTELKGKYKKTGDREFWKPMTVKNISAGGCGFTIRTTPKLEIGEVIHVEFVLDDGKDSKVSKRATIRVLEDKYLGTQFVTQPGTYDAALGFYLRKR